MSRRGFFAPPQFSIANGDKIGAIYGPTEMGMRQDGITLPARFHRMETLMRRNRCIVRATEQYCLPTTQCRVLYRFSPFRHRLAML
jgi:hypothetical protein